MFLKAERYVPDPSRNVEWNRGAYLVQGLGHCGACHTPRNAMGGERQAQALTGGTYQKTHMFTWNAFRRLAKTLRGRYVLVCVAPDDGVLPLLDVALRKRRGQVTARAYTLAP